MWPCTPALSLAHLAFALLTQQRSKPLNGQCCQVDVWRHGLFLKVIFWLMFEVGSWAPSKIEPQPVTSTTAEDHFGVFKDLMGTCTLQGRSTQVDKMTTPAKLAHMNNDHLKSPTPWLSREVGGCIVQNMNNTFRIYKLKGQYCNTSAISRYASIKLN